MRTWFQYSIAFNLGDSIHYLRITGALYKSYAFITSL